VTNDGIDRDQLTSMAKLAREEMGVDKLAAVADRGYYKSEETLAFHEAGNKRVCSEDGDIERNGSWPLRQGRLHLKRGDERISVPSWRATHPAIFNR
jgi:hypothetical protein